MDWLFVGLGNPGPEYSGTRHNVGFEALDGFAKLSGDKSRFSGRPGKMIELSVNRLKLGMLKPATFMNLSGDALLACRRRPDEIEHIVVFHDDLDFELGRVAIKSGGGAGGHKGLKSIISAIGPGFTRIRMGIGKPMDGTDPADYVLRRFAKGERDLVLQMVDRACDAAGKILCEGVLMAMNEINRCDKNPCSAGHAGPEGPKGGGK